jgi:hypothetical protein
LIAGARHDFVIGQLIVTENIEFSQLKSQVSLRKAQRRDPESFNLSSGFNREQIFVTIIPATIIDDKIRPDLNSFMPRRREHNFVMPILRAVTKQWRP